MKKSLSRRKFIKHVAAVSGAVASWGCARACAVAGLRPAY